MLERNRTWPWLAAQIPRAGIVLFLLGYVVAAARYPGGSRLDPQAVGYAHFGNFWCDLLDVTSYNGRPNAGRPVALVATWLLPVMLLPLWFELRHLWPRAVRTRWIVPAFGTVAMVATIGVTTRAHDAAINVGALAAAVALGTLLWRLHAARLRTLLLTGALAVTAGACDYAAYIGGAPAAVLPGLQKLAGAALLLWLWHLSGALRETRAA
ncbi:MAG: hypothetical protein K2R93_06835 [Gemmatimonadaceae bacterium]|nr:hypothetical protein [Gemmatimonadaceae bacterium]